MKQKFLEIFHLYFSIGIQTGSFSAGGLSLLTEQPKCRILYKH
jgi:hypothetical protein